jgi:peptide/nickel transport system permease protein
MSRQVNSSEGKSPSEGSLRRYVETKSPTALSRDQLPVSSGRLWGFLRALWNHQTGMIGGAILTILILIALFAPVVAPYPPNEANFDARVQSPSIGHPFGTDAIGRDVFSRIIHGARISLRSGIIAVAIAAAGGTLLGLVSGYYGGLIDAAIMRVTDLFLAMPAILLAMIFIFTLGPTLTNLMIAVGLSSIPYYTRTVRGSVLSARENVYVEAARATGASDGRVILRHVLPNVVAPVMVLATLGCGTAILAIASLSFLGLGAQPPTPEWGAIVSAGRDRLATAWWISTFGGIAIMITVLSINLLGDALRDIYDPRLRGR